MFEAIGSGINYALGLDVKELNLWQMRVKSGGYLCCRVDNGKGCGRQTFSG